MTALASTGRKLAVIGDSVMYQTVVGLECSWLREGCRNVRSVNNKSPSKTPYEKRVFKGEYPGPAWKYGIGGFEEWTVACPSPVSSSSSSSSNAAVDDEVVANVNFYLQYRPYPDFVDLSTILSDHSVDTLLLNSGLHYLWSDGPSFESETKGVLQVVKRLVSDGNGRNVVLWRETTQQHRDSIGGEWSTKELSKECRDVSFGDDFTFQWRDKMVRGFMDELGFEIVEVEDAATGSLRSPEKTPIHWIKFANFTLGKSFFHPHNDEDQCEPTHFCQTPTFWEYICKSPTHSNRSHTTRKPEHIC